MNRAAKAALINFQANPFDLKAAFFHSTPVLDRRRRNHWDSRSNCYSRNYRKMNSKQELLRNVSAFAETLFQNMDYVHDEYESSSSRGSSWFRPDYRDRGFRGYGTNHKRPQAGVRSGFHFCEDDVEVETLFRSAFGGNRHFFWSFINDEPQRSSSGYYNNYRTSWNWTHPNEEDYDTDSDSLESDLSKERKTLGLSVSGPINMDDVKNAYRKCALKWHPDRHQGSSKVVAEEKFKVCSAAYQLLCDKIAIG